MTTTSTFRAMVCAASVALLLLTVTTAGAICPPQVSATVLNGGLERPNGVPNYDQSDFPIANDCGPAAMAMLLGYWDSNGWPELVRGDSPYSPPSGPTTGVRDMVRLLQHTAPFDRGGNLGTWDAGTIFPMLTGGIGEYVVETAALQDWPAANWTSDDHEDVWFSDVAAEIDADRPLLLLVKLYDIEVVDSVSGGVDEISQHWMTIFGYRREVRSGYLWPLGCVDALAIDEEYLMLRSGYENGSDHYYTYNWSALDDLYSVEVVPASSSAADGDSRGFWVGLSNPTWGAGSCAGQCGGASSGCYCDAACVWYADCCADYAPVCTLQDGAFTTSKFGTQLTDGRTRTVTGDFDGNGKTDALRFGVSSDGPSSDGAFVGLSDGYSFGAFLPWAEWVTSEAMHVVVADFDQDGDDDVVTIDVPFDGHPVIPRVRVGLSNSGRFDKQIWGTLSGIDRDAWVTVAQLNPGGFPDLVIVHPSGFLEVGINTGSGFDFDLWGTWTPGDSHRFVAGDFDGDGLTDVAQVVVAAVGTETTAVNVARSTGSTFDVSEWGQWTTTPFVKVLAGDFDGDGNDDLMRFDVSPPGEADPSGLWVGRSTGGAFVTSQFATWITTTEMKVLSGDFNGDGKDDVMKFDVPRNGPASRGLWTGLSTGGSFVTTKWDQWTTDSFLDVLTGDFDGDGKLDVLGVDRSGQP